MLAKTFSVLIFCVRGDLYHLRRYVYYQEYNDPEVDLNDVLLFEDKLPNKDYWWQGQGYMELAGKEHYSVDYMLMDTPDDDSLTYKHLGRPLRVKSFPFERDRDCMKEVQERVQLCRDYIKTLIDDDMIGAMSSKPSDISCFGEDVEI